MKKYRLVEENELRRLIEGNMIYDLGFIDIVIYEMENK